jgi:RNA polymerase sigma-70 factor (ECF subfamily)
MPRHPPQFAICASDIDVCPVAGVVLSKPSALRSPRAADPLEDLVLKIRRHDEMALRALHLACSRRLQGFALGIVHRHELAEEVVSTTFMQAWRDAGGFDPERANVMTWLCTIARSRSLDVLRQLSARGRREVSMEEQDVEGIADAADGPIAVLLQKQLRECLRKSIERLAPIQRQVLCLAFIEGLSHEEVAGHTGLPLGTVKSHARRALIALRARGELASIAA